MQRTLPCEDRAVAMRCGVVLAGRLLAAVPATFENATLRREVPTSRRHLQAPIAIGHPDARLARYFGAASAVVAIPIRSKTRTVGRRAAARFPVAISAVAVPAGSRRVLPGPVIGGGS